MPVVSETFDPNAARRCITGWYQSNGRQLAFRASAEPWGVLVSEVMLQQTQVARVEPAWTRFMAQFPTPSDLAAAAPADAIRAWSGLGYNRRALNLWRAAGQIVERHRGCVPDRLDDLLALPGVGAYTARAVAAIGFGVPVAAVDTNVRRVVLRLHGESDPRLAQTLADALVDPDAPDRWTHAVMDIGATLCRPNAPCCSACPLASMCVFAAAQRGVVVGDAPVVMSSDPARSSRTARGTLPPFEQTSRWLRGRIVDRLREAPAGTWVRIDGSIGSHGAAAVERAIAALVAEGLLDADYDGRVRLAAGEASEVAA
jgi:A/G-specific adenine glycosylase